MAVVQMGLFRVCSVVYKVLDSYQMMMIIAVLRSKTDYV